MTYLDIYEKIDKIHLTREQIGRLISIDEKIFTNNNILNIIEKIKNNDTLIIDKFYGIGDPLLIESSQNETIFFHELIPETLIKYMNNLTPSGITYILEQIENIEIDDSISTIKHQLDEMVLSGDIKVPVNTISLNDTATSNNILDYLPTAYLKKIHKSLSNVLGYEECKYKKSKKLKHKFQPLSKNEALNAFFKKLLQNIKRDN